MSATAGGDVVSTVDTPSHTPGLLLRLLGQLQVPQGQLSLPLEVGVTIWCQKIIVTLRGAASGPALVLIGRVPTWSRGQMNTGHR